MTPPPAPAVAEMVAPDTDWTLWYERRPVDTQALYRWRIASRKICGMELRPEWSGKLHLCGMGYGASEWWPSGSHWDGYRRTMPKSLEWRLAKAEEPEGTIFWGGLDLLPCPFTGALPRVTYSGRWIGAPPWEVEYLNLKSYLVDTHFRDANKLAAAWNQRPPVSARTGGGEHG